MRRDLDDGGRAARLQRSAACRWTASGVVRGGENSSSPMTTRVVLQRPQGAALASISCSRAATVVLPFVPVTPTTRSLRLGSPYQAHASDASARRASRTRSQHAGRGPAAGAPHSATTAAAPRATASGTKTAPSKRKPGTATKTLPGSTLRES